MGCDINKWWAELFALQEFFYTSKARSKHNTPIQSSNYESHTINNVIIEYDYLKPQIQEQLKKSLTPFENLFDKKLGLYNEQHLLFQVKPNVNLYY